MRQENKYLTDRRIEAEGKIAELEQYIRHNNVEIKGFPFTVKDKAAEMAEKIAQTIHVPLDPTEIDIANSVKTKSGKDVNLVRFTSRSKRNLFLATAKKANLTTKLIGSTGPKQRLYVYEHLTAENKRLLGAAIPRTRGVLEIFLDAERQCTYFHAKQKNLISFGSSLKQICLK